MTNSCGSLLIAQRELNQQIFVKNYISEIVDRFPYPASKLREVTGFLTFISSLIEHLLVTGLLIGQDLKMTPFGIWKIVTHFLIFSDII